MRRGQPQRCYKTCGPEKSGAKSETCTGGVVRGDVGLQLRAGARLRLLQDPGGGQHRLPGRRTPQASTDCTVDHCVVCNSTGGLPGGGYRDSGGAAKAGYCVCQAANSAGKRTWSCASDTAVALPRRLGLLSPPDTETNPHKAEPTPAHETTACVVRTAARLPPAASLLSALSSRHDEPPIPAIATCAVDAAAPRRCPPGAPRCGAGNPDLPQEPLWRRAGLAPARSDRRRVHPEGDARNAARTAGPRRADGQG